MTAPRNIVLTTIAAALLFPAGASAQALTGGWGATGDRPGQFEDIRAITTDRKGYVYVADKISNGDGRIQKFTPTGQIVRQWGRSADEDKRGDNDQVEDLLVNPTGITVGPDDNLYVSESDSDRDRISVWSPTGRFLRAFGSSGSGFGQLGGATGLDFDSFGNLIVADGSNGRLGIFTAKGAAVGSFGDGPIPDESPDPGLSSPDGLTLGPDGLLYVVDRGEIKRYTSQGVFMGALGQSGSDTGAFFESIGGLAFAGTDLIVPDPGLSRVQRFNGGGAYVGPVGGTPGSQPGQYAMPVAAAVDCRGSVYVADAGNHRIQRFGNSGAGTCSDLSKDTSERFKTSIKGSVQDFREDFAVRPSLECNKPCRATLTGTIKIKGRKALKLDTRRFGIDFPGGFTTDIAATERGTDLVISSLRRNRRVTARITFRAVDGTGQKKTRTRSYRLR